MPFRGSIGRSRSVVESAVVTVYAFCVIFGFINSRSFWLDEAISVSISSQSYDVMTRILQHVDGVHALYYSVLHVWLLFGHSAVFIRSLSAIFALAALVSIGILAKEMFGRLSAPAAVAVLSTSVFFLFYADEARSIAFTLMSCSYAALFFWRALNEARQRDIAFFAVFAIISIYANFLAVLFMAGLAVSLAAVRPPRKTIIQMVVGAVVISFAIVPLVLLIHRNSLVQIDWIKRGTLKTIVHFIASILGGDGGAGRVGLASGFIEAAVVFALITLGVISGWRSRNTRSIVVAASIWFVVPLTLGLVVDRFFEPILVARYFSFALIPAALLAGNGLAIIRGRSRPAFAYTIVAVLAVISIHSLLTVQREDWRSVSRLLKQDTRSGDGLVFWTPATITPYEFAVHEEGAFPAARIVYPSGQLINGVVYPKPQPGFERTLSRKFKTMWVVESHDAIHRTEPSPFGALSGYYAHKTERIFPGIEVLMYSR